jgi:hypothetical protein
MSNGDERQAADGQGHGPGPGGPDGVVTHDEALGLDLLRPASRRLADFLTHILKQSAFHGDAVALRRQAMRGLVGMLSRPGGKGRAARAAFAIQAYPGFDGP